MKYNKHSIIYQQFMISKQNILILLLLGWGIYFTSCKKENTDNNIPSDATKLLSVNTLEATDIMAKSAVLNGLYRINDKAEIISIGFFLASHSFPSENDTVIALKTEEIGDSTFSCTLSGLNNNQVYYYQTFLENSKGTITGDVTQFKTQTGMIKLITLSPVELSAEILLSRGEIQENEGQDIVETGICWSESKNPTINNNKIVSLTDNTTFQVEIEGRDAATYYFRAFALTADEQFYGNQIEHTFHFIIDKRDNKSYKYVEIGEQTWLAENMAWMPELCPANEGCGFWPPNNKGEDSITITPNNKNYKQYGVLYSFDEATDACPEGWKLPTHSEWQNLFDFIQEQGYSKNNGKALKSIDAWSNNGNGTDVFGFNALPTGYRDFINQKIMNAGTQTCYWSATPNAGEGVYSRILHSNSDEAQNYVAYRYSGCSVRCIKIKE